MGIQEPIRIEFSEYANLGYRTRRSKWQKSAKSMTDKAVAGTALVVLSPLLLMVAAGIKIESKGPVIFKQPRHGLGNKTFNVWKFRTMKVMETGGDFKQATRNDPRVTRFGSFLRKTSIDELPQLVNIFRGEMSLIGPRPHPVSLNEQFGQRIPGFWLRHAVKPGLSGLAQIRGYRGPTDAPHKMRMRVESDLEYIDRWSFWLDLKILLLTPFLAVTGKNAF